MSDYDGGSIRPEDDYFRARERALDAGRSVEGDQAWKSAQDDMYRAQQEAEWRRRDHEREAAGRGGDTIYTASTPGDATAAGASARPGKVSLSRKYPVSFAIADSFANSTAAMCRLHPGLFQLVFRGIALTMCWPIPLLQAGLARVGLSAKVARVPLVFVGWMVYLVLLSRVLVHM